MDNKFLGKWTLLAERSEYEAGQPPKSATYEFRDAGNADLGVTIEWADAEGQEHRIDYRITVDGKRKSYENPEIADEVMSEYVGENGLNSSTYKGGKRIMFAARLIGEDGVMRVSQKMLGPDGREFENVQYYRK
ncbi:hypothetical protein FUAX_13170 [Fulvitalea axinellae]|uniref:Lipocalin-like domain-containing protein n=1 Tax=Fulvitalea axinellae TaxID=1182444 RepID=A0AAU9CI02_9BACT|nr:hypothetical protein FUAX_13170 [Fulvitalea axinellae]